MLRIGFDMSYNLLETAVVLDKFESGIRPNLGNRIDIVAAEKYAEIDELHLQ